MKKIAILNGPNLNWLGKREPEIYGTATLKDLERLVRAEARQLGVTVKFFQSNHEGALIDAIHAFADAGTDGFIVNFGAYSHTSIALHDALKSVSRPAIEVHISDIKKREKFRRHSMTADACIGMISGRGFPGYVEALRRLATSERRSVAARFRRARWFVSTRGRGAKAELKFSGLLAECSA